MRKRILLLVVMALLALALFAPAAIAQDEDDGDDDRGAAAGGALPRTGGPALIAPVAGALLFGSGVIVGVVSLRRRNS